MGKHSLKGAGRPGVFLDRDGVLNEPLVRDGHPYPPKSLNDLQIYPDAVAGCVRLKRAGFLLIVVSNQPDVGRGTQTRAVVDAINARIATEIPALDHFETCFHGGDKYGQPCLCRKPKPGMLFRVGDLMHIDLPASYFIGDRWRDVDCAKAAGCRAVFIDRSYSEPLRQLPDVTVTTFEAAVSAVLKLASRDFLPLGRRSI